MAKYDPEEEDFNIWPTYSDIGFAIVLILVFIILAQYVVIGKIIIITEIENTQKELSEKLEQTFPKEYGKSILDSAEPQLQKITFSDKILFDSGSDILKPEGRRILRGVANILIGLRNDLRNDPRDRREFDEIQIRGHTDDVPINTRKFPTNWELSSARATSVVRFFVDVCGLKPEKGFLLSAQGYSEFDAIRANDSPENKALNRRIEIVIKYPLPRSITLTEQSLQNLKSEGLPDDVINKLTTIKNKEFENEEKFLETLQLTIGHQQTEKYKSLILKHISLSN